MNDRLKEAFGSIRAEEELKNHTLEFLSAKRNGCLKNKILLYRKLMAAAACFLLLFFGGTGYYAYFQQVFVISVDVNPSLELGINRLEKVISVKAYNEDGDMLLSSLDVRYLDYRDALGQILESGSMQGYVAEGQPVSVTVFGKNEKKSREILDHVAEYTASYQNVHCACASQEEVNDAHACGMSYGKYRTFLELQILDPGLTPEDVRDLSMCQIQERIDTLSGGPDNGLQGHGHGHGAADNGHAGHGKGHGGNRHNSEDGCENGNESNGYKSPGKADTNQR